ncbi:MFS transporter [Peterkaempfera griseoplana]|uniref:MFS transporter n=1 Tax=Peterkaempfera griseoplana TaxID=66896 RepID=UPI0006E30DE8|nr:MFS transporter [Peterkaempfera griseoplana]
MARLSARPLLRNGNFLLLTSGQVVSSAGDQVQDFALLLLVLAMAGSSGQAGLVLGLNSAAFLLSGLFAGALVDRWDRRRTMVWCELGRAAAAGSVAAALWTGRLTLPHLYAFAAVGGILSSLFQAAGTAALVNVVGPDRLPAALATTQGVLGAVRVGGAPLGALVQAAGRAVPFAFNAASFLVSAVTLRLMRASFRTRRPAADGRSVLADIREGIGWLWRRPVLRLLLLAQTADTLRYGAGYLVIISLAQAAGASPVQIGLVFTGAAIGALLGSLLAPRAAARLPLGRLTVLMLWVEALTFPLYAVAPGPLLLGVVAAAESVIAPIHSVAISSHRLSTTPDRLRGRTSAAVQTLTAGALSAGAALGGALVAVLGARATTLVLAGWLALLALSVTASRRVRTAGSGGSFAGPERRDVAAHR